MWPRTSCPLSSWTLNIVLGRASTISPSISIFSSLGTAVGRLDGADVHRLRTLVARLLLVLDLRVLGERLETLAIDSRVVDEQVTVSVVRSDEAVALLVVEPLDGSGRHELPLPACARPVFRRESAPRHLQCSTTPAHAGPDGTTLPGEGGGRERNRRPVAMPSGTTPGGGRPTSYGTCPWRLRRRAARSGGGAGAHARAADQ